MYTKAHNFTVKISSNLSYFYSVSKFWEELTDHQREKDKKRSGKELQIYSRLDKYFIN